MIKQSLQIAKKEGLPIRQTYRRVLKRLSIDQRFRNHPKNKSKARRADKKVKTIAGRLVRELERNLGESSKHLPSINRFKLILKQTRSSSNKIYSLHEPAVECISKGKVHKKTSLATKVH